MGIWYASSVTARVILEGSSLQVVPVARASTSPQAVAYSRGVYVRFSAFAAFLAVALVLGAVSLLPGLKELALGTVIAGLFAALAGLSGAERAQFERNRVR